MNSAYVIATQTKLDVSKVKIPEHIDDDYFKRIDLKERRGKKSDIFKDGKQVRRYLHASHYSTQYNTIAVT